MKVYLEQGVSRGAMRGPSKFMGKLVTAMEKIGVFMKHDSYVGSEISFTLPHWKLCCKGIHKVRPRLMRADGSLPGGSDARRLKYAKRILASDVVVWQSEFVKRAASKLFDVPSIGPVIHNGEDPDIYKVARIPSDGKHHVVMMSNWKSAGGRFRPEKRLSEMLHVANEFSKKNRDVEFWVIGDTGINHPPNPSIKFLGRMPHHELVRYMVSANCMLFLGWCEWCPNAMVEALVPGTPVICLNGSGAEELVKIGFGEVLPLEPPVDISYYRNHGAHVPRIELDAVQGALDRWSRCQIKRPAKELFISRTAEKYKDILERTVRGERWAS